MRSDEGGTALILTIGYALIALVLVLVCADATHLYLAHKRTDAAADAAAIGGAQAFTIEVVGGKPVARLTDGGVEDAARGIIDQFDAVRLVSADTPDGVTARVRVSTRWRPPMFTIFVPTGLTIESTATSRTAIN